MFRAFEGVAKLADKKREDFTSKDVRVLALDFTWPPQNTFVVIGARASSHFAHYNAMSSIHVSIHIHRVSRPWPPFGPLRGVPSSA
jgi:hypothetical protein